MHCNIQHSDYPRLRILLRCYLYTSRWSKLIQWVKVRKILRTEDANDNANPRSLRRKSEPYNLLFALPCAGLRCASVAIECIRPSQPPPCKDSDVGWHPPAHTALTSLHGLPKSSQTHRGSEYSPGSLKLTGGTHDCALTILIFYKSLYHELYLLILMKWQGFQSITFLSTLFMWTWNVYAVCGHSRDVTMSTLYILEINICSNILRFKCGHATGTGVVFYDWTLLPSVGGHSPDRS